ncbi:DUF4276 family protein [Pedobacter changchengzhani]|uniref:DUF4276 family protein n=1 Tax=Pedobacter changchengzhani TaxID=2529274 RepID=A0A4R5MQN7_9SPHI|nr:DUF4276 family protein [Pedobacter changchengzhani]TDG37579.1 DUF4276 family protein [Pedobacter changchengzhani]
MRVGLIGEAPNDTFAIGNLLSRNFENVHFFNLIENIRGSMLDNQKTKHFLRIEYQTQKPDIVIFIRDLDSLYSDTIQLKKRKDYFADFNTVVNKKGIFLLNIYEIEALILADHEAFNSLYDSDLKEELNPMDIFEPKELLYLTTRKLRRKYSESDCPEIFKTLDVNILVKKCPVFKMFIDKLSNEILN